MSGRPSWARKLTTISLVIAVIALVFTVRDIGLGTLATYLRRIGWWWLAVIPLEILTTTLDASAIRAFASPEKPPLRATLLSQVAGRAVNAVTPSGNVGELVKMTVLTDVVSESRAVATILLYNVVTFSVELLVVAVAAFPLALLVPMPAGLRTLLLISGVLCFVLSIGLYVLVHRGMLVGVAKLATRLRLLSKPRYERWHARLQGVDDKMRLVAGARRRDRWLGIFLCTVSRLNSIFLSLLILHAVGEAMTVKFVAAYTAGQFFIYMLASLVPMGLGISEGGYDGLFRALGENPARGVTLAFARRAVTIVYAAVGLFLVTTSETVKRARQRQKAPAPAPVPQVQPAAVPVLSMPPEAP
ncbi:MAG: lysylphosphatidylglycerol synthase transmembrane domain-containing protein [Acidobacteriota bacterium]